MVSQQYVLTSDAGCVSVQLEHKQTPKMIWKTLGIKYPAVDAAAGMYLPVWLDDHITQNLIYSNKL